MTCLEEERKLYRTIRDTIQISQKALFIDVNELPTQLLNRLGKKDNSFRLLMDNCRKVAFPILICDQQLLATPGGNLQHSFPSHQGRVVSLDLTRDDNTAVTCKFKGHKLIVFSRFCWSSSYIVRGHY